MLERTNIDPLDLVKSKGVGVALPFSDKAVFRTTYETKEAIKYNLINLLLTGRQERYFNLNFGTNLKNLLFENITENQLDALKTSISETISIYYPKVNINNISASFNTSTSSILVQINYSIFQTNIEDDLLISIEQ